MLLTLPFLYIASLKRGTQRKAREYTLRGYTGVDVAELASDDMPVAITVALIKTTYGQPPMRRFTDLYRVFGDALVLPVTKSGESVSGRAFEKALAEGAEPYQRRWPPVPFGPRKFPTPGMRTGYNPQLDPMNFPTLAELLLEMNGEGQPLSGSDFALRELDARVHLEKAVVLLDGQVHTEVPEPVWRTDISRFGLFLYSPDVEAAAMSYRIDRPPSQKAGSDWHGSDEVTIADPAVLRRDDVLELAKSAMALWPKWRLRALSAGGELAGPAGLFARVDHIAAAGAKLSPENCVTVLETYCKARTALAACGQRFWDKGHSVPDRAGAIASRWRRERDAYVAQHGGLDLNDEDRAALEGAL